MKAFIVIKKESDNHYVLEIHPQNDAEIIALQAWSERYDKNDGTASLLLVRNEIKSKSE